MRTIILLLSIALATQFTVAQQRNAFISFETEKYDFGQIKEDGGPVEYTFKFTNTGSVPLIIQEVTASCGCTTPTWTREPILPGKTGMVKASFNPMGRPNAFIKDITVRSNADNSAVILKISGNVIPRALGIEELYPRLLGTVRFKSTHIPIGQITFGTVKTDSLQYINMGDKDAALSLMDVPPHITYKAVPEVLKPNQKGYMLVTFDSKVRNDWDFISDRISLGINGERVPNAIFSITASVMEDYSKLTPEQKANAPKISFENTTFDFGTLKANEKIEHKYAFTNTGKTDLIIRKVSASCGCTAIQPTKTVLKPGETSEIIATFNATSAGRQNKSITVISNDPDNSRVFLRIQGEVVAQ